MIIHSFWSPCGGCGLPRPFHTEGKPANEFCFSVAPMLRFCEQINEIGSLYAGYRQLIRFEDSAIIFHTKYLTISAIFALLMHFLDRNALFVHSQGASNVRQGDFEKICMSDLSLYKTCDMRGQGVSKFQKRYKTMILG